MATLTREQMIERFFARDKAFETAFVVGVVTTGIYCVPTCSARKPRAENVRFFATLDEARSAGLRACRRCHPDDVHAGLGPEERDRAALERAVRELRDAPADFEGVRALGRRAGFGGTKLTELTRRHYHTSPRTLISRARVAAAQRALLDSEDGVLDVGLTVGFESASAFHDNFRAETGLAPGDYRAMARTGEFELRLPTGYPIDHVLRAIGRDPDGRTERVDGHRLARALLLEGRPALAEIELGRGRARARITARRTLGPSEIGQAHGAIRRLLGLTIDPRPLERRAPREPEVRRLIEGRRGLRIPQTPDAFEGLVWAIVGQQVNLAFAFTCRNRLINLAGSRAGGGLTAHPTPAAVAKLDYADLTRLQYSRRKAEYLIDTARSIAEGELDLESASHGSAVSAEERLLAVRGIGPWSARYVMMRSFGFADCVPVGDAGLVNALKRHFDLDARPGPAETEALMERFAPHRSLATFHLWKTLGEPA